MQDSSTLRERFSLMRDRHGSSASSSSRRVYKLNIPDRYSSAEDFSLTDKTASTSASSSSPSSFASVSAFSSSLNAFRSLRMPRRRHHAAQQQKRCSIGTTGTSVVTICNEEEDEDDEQQHHRFQQLHGNQQDDEDDIAILQPEEDEPSSPEKRSRRWRRSFSSMRMALSRSSSLNSSSSASLSSSKKPATTMYSISFYPWKRDPRAYYSHPDAAAEWVPDTASKRCQICLAAFHLTRRRHHCRLCGLLACNDCSMQRTYFPFSKDRRSQHHLIKDGAPQRTCNACAGTLKNMAAQHDPRVKKFTVHPPVADPFGMRDDLDDFDARRSSSQWRVSIGDDDIYVVDGGKGSSQSVHMALVACGGSGVSQRQADELDEVLRARALSRRNPKPKYFVVSTEWLEQWLQYVHVDAPPSSSSAPSSSRTQSSSRYRKAFRNARPGPISNYSLLDFVSGKLVAKDDLERSRGNDAGGDYRIVSEEVWSVFVRLYGGGPCIQLRMDDGSGQQSPSKPGQQQQQQAMVRKHSALNEGRCNGATDPSRWVIMEIDDTIPPLISKAPTDFLKNSKNMRRAASTSSLDRTHSSISSAHSGSARKASSVYPIRETAPCIMSDAEPRTETQPYYPRDSIVNCITSPPCTAEELKTAPLSHTSSSQRHHRRHKHKRDASEISSSSSSSNVFAKVSVGTVLYEPASPPKSAGGQVAAVSAFALAAAEARKKSALSLSRHSSALSSSMVKSSRVSAAATAPASA